MQPVIHPQILELRTRILDLQAQIEQTVQEWYTLVHQERKVLNNVYTEEFGELEKELQYLAVKEAEIFRRVELLSIKSTRGELLTEDIIKRINAVVDKEYARYHRRLREAFEMDATEREVQARAGKDRIHDTEIVDMYRTLVKQIHPDVAEKESSAELWNNVQTAYKEKNASQLRSLLKVIGAHSYEPDGLQGKSLEDLEKEVLILETTLRVEKRKVSRIQNQEPFTIKEGLYNDEWKIQHRKKLQKDIERYKHSIIENKKTYAELTGHEIAMLENSEEKEDEQTFEKEFMDNTYFKGR